MCGITGYWQQPYASREELVHRIQHMANSLAHRGPDDEGIWVDENVGVALGHRRLSIVDLSPSGHQPMTSNCGCFVISYNGEVYNFAEIRKELESTGHTFRGHSDTEVILAAIVEWGLEATVKRSIGMFALALWDRKLRRLSLVRDRIGIKPLYYGWMGSTLLFGSELKALRAHPDFIPEVDRDSLTLLLRHNAIPSPYSIYRGIHKLPPGCILTISSHTESNSLPVPYWSMRQVAEQQVHNPFRGSEAEAAEYLESILSEAVKMRMVADVPLGAFLSGGIDSSIVVALMQAHSQRPVKTFTIGFHEAGYNEAVHARSVATHLGTEHTELYITPVQSQSMIPKIPVMFDEPFSDSSQIPTFLLSQMTRQHVNVSLSGDGGDELFGGYKRYSSAKAIWRTTGWLPRWLIQDMRRSITAFEPEVYNRWLCWLAPLMDRFGRPGSVGDKLYKASEVLQAENFESMYRLLVSHWKTPANLVINGCEPPTVLTDQSHLALLKDATHKMMYLDTISYLPDDILTKVDRTSMAVSLEARVPLLDHRVVEFSWRLPMSMKVKNGQSKWLLRQVLYKFVPQSIMQRPKMGFGVPLGAWLRGPLQDWAESLLNESRLRQEGFFHPAPIRKKWKEHLLGQYNWQYYLWDVLTFQAWLEEWKGK